MKNLFSFFIIFLLSLSSSYVFAAKQGGTLIFARYQEPLTLDPFIPADNGSIWAIEQICDSLTEPGDTGNELVPGLAESWDISDDGLTYTFHIRDTKHSNGDPVTAQDTKTLLFINNTFSSNWNHNSLWIRCQHIFLNFTTQLYQHLTNKTNSLSDTNFHKPRTKIPKSFFIS